MQSRRMPNIWVIAALLALMLLVPGSASATRLYKYTTPSPNDQIGLPENINLTIESGQSVALKDTLGGLADTCTSSELLGTIETTGGSEPLYPEASLSIVNFGGCSHTTTVISAGKFAIKHIAGTTNGTFVLSQLKVTTKSTVFGISCLANAGSGTSMGTVTGSSGLATLHMNGLISLENGCGDATWAGTYRVTKPAGMIVEAS